MKKTLLLMPIALLLASCGGGGNNPGPKPSSKELLFGKTFKYSSVVIEKTDEIVSWLEQNKEKIVWRESGQEESYARMEYYDEETLYSKPLNKPETLNVDNIYAAMNYVATSEYKVYETFSGLEIDINENGEGALRFMDDDEGEPPVMSGLITTADLEGSEHGEGVKFEGSISDAHDTVNVSGTFMISEWEDDKISRTLMSLTQNEGKPILNTIEFKFPISDNADDDFTIGGLINLLPATE